MKVLITGGHLTPALAVIKELKKHKDAEIVFVGRQYTDENNLTLSYEYSQIEKLGVPFIHLTTGRFTKKFSIRTILNYVKIFFGIIESFLIIREFKPNAVLSFGGYLGFPISFVAGLLHINVFIHEQTIMPGLANRIAARYAKKVFIAFPESKRFFSSHITSIVGNPLRNEIFHSQDAPFGDIGQKPIIYITGGSLGAHSLNVHIENILPELLKKFVVVHQTGNVAEYGDYDRLAKISLEYKNYVVRTHIFDSEIGWLFKNASLVVSRSGANTIFELIALQKPAVLVPLPWSASGEQKLHAEILQSHHVAEIFDQKDESLALLELILKVYANVETYQHSYKSLQKYIIPHPEEHIVKTILSQS